MTNQNSVEVMYEISNVESTYYLKATKGNIKRFYNFKDYELLKKVYSYRLAEGFELEVTIK